VVVHDKGGHQVVNKYYTVGTPRSGLAIPGPLFLQLVDKSVVSASEVGSDLLCLPGMRISKTIA
jgi:hypothetical protein